MSVNEKLRAAVLPIVPICEPDAYAGEESEYCTFDYAEVPDAFGDDMPQAIRYLVSLHWYLPRGVNPIAKKKQIRKALLVADFTAPTITNASDDDGQHYVFECEYWDGDV